MKFVAHLAALKVLLLLQGSVCNCRGQFASANPKAVNMNYFMNIVQKTNLEDDLLLKTEAVQSKLIDVASLRPNQELSAGALQAQGRHGLQPSLQQDRVAERQNRSI